MTDTPDLATAPDINPIILEMHKQNDRGAAICGAAFLEEGLQTAIEGDWPPLSNTMRARIFRGFGPLSTFSAKIEVSFAMGLISVPQRTDYLIIKSVRNDAAHVGLPFSFDAPEVSEKIAKLRCVEDQALIDRYSDSQPRNTFTGAIKMLYGMLWLVTHMPIMKRKPRMRPT